MWERRAQMITDLWIIIYYGLWIMGCDESVGLQINGALGPPNKWRGIRHFHFHIPAFRPNKKTGDKC